MHMPLPSNRSKTGRQVTVHLNTNKHLNLRQLRPCPRHNSSSCRVHLQRLLANNSLGGQILQPRLMPLLLRQRGNIVSNSHSYLKPDIPTHPTPAKGDRTHIPSPAQPIYTILSAEMARVEARAPASFKPQVVDTRKRLEILFDHLNNEDLLKPDTVQELVELSQALERRDFTRAAEIQMDVHTNKVEECGNWIVGLKRLVSMCRQTP